MGGNYAAHLEKPVAIWPGMIARHILCEIYAAGGSVSEHLDEKTCYFSSGRALHVFPLLESLGYHIGLYCTRTNPLHLPIHLLMLKNSQNVNMSSSVCLKNLALLKTSYKCSGNEECCPWCSCAAVCGGVCGFLSHRMGR